MPINLNLRDEWIVGMVTIGSKLGVYGPEAKYTTWSKTRDSAKDKLKRQNLRTFTRGNFDKLETALKQLAADGRLPQGDMQSLIDECDYFLSHASCTIELRFVRNNEAPKGTMIIPYNAGLKSIAMMDKRGGEHLLWVWDMPMSWRGGL